MRRLLLAAVVAAGSLGIASAAPPLPSSALPPGAHLLATAALPGYPRSYAMAFHNGHNYLAVEVTGPGARLVWSHEVGGLPARLDTPGPEGVFRALVNRPGGQGQWLFAFRYHGAKVTSAIAGVRSGYVTGNESIQLKRTGFTISTRDTAHVGSVHYQYETTYSWRGAGYRPTAKIRVPDYPRGKLPVPSGLIRTPQGNVTLIRLEVADTPALREKGLMYRKQLDPDSGMLFVWPTLAHDSFWMQDTYIPLTVAFLGPGGRIQETQDMAPLSTALHTPALPYEYAIEVNQGFFARDGIYPGYVVQLNMKKGGGT